MSNQIKDRGREESDPVKREVEELRLTANENGNYL